MSGKHSGRLDKSIHFLPSGRVHDTSDSLNLLELAQAAEVPVFNTCNGVGTCGKCLVKVEGETSPVTRSELKFLSQAQLDEGWRLACQAWPHGDVTVETPEVGPQQILTDGLAVDYQLAPNIIKRPFSLPEPNLEDQLGDYERACRALEIPPDLNPPIEVLRSLAASVRPSWEATAVLADEKILAVEPGDTSETMYGAAFDIGTTTIVGFLHNLWTGDEPAVTSLVNPQTAYGADVITRIEHAINAPGGLKRLQADVTGAMNSMLEALAAEAGISVRDIYCVSVAGNTVMQHLFTGIDPRNIAFAPFIPVFQTGVVLPAAGARLKVNPAGRVFLMPCVSSYVGGDIVADILASRLYELPGRNLLVDIGTNGEIALGVEGEVIACAAPAGPCFEGANISSGMQAVEGAINTVRIEDGDFVVTTIGNAPARGFCGSGLIDAVAALLDSGIVDETGRVVDAEEMPDTVTDRMKARLGEGQDGKAFMVFTEGENGPVKLTQGDIRELQNAKGSIGAGIEVICQRSGISTNELDSILLAGAFGNFLNPRSAVRIGLLPQVPLERVQSIGNAAGVGARMALLSKDERVKARDVSRRVRYVELSGTVDFREAYMDAMFFPCKM